MSTLTEERLDAPIAARYRALFHVSEAISAHRDPQELFCGLAAELREVVKSDHVSVVLFDETTHRVSWRVLDTAGRCGVAPPGDVTPEETPSWWVFQHQEPLVIPFADRETRFRRIVEFFEEQGIQSACVLPLTTAHRRLGALGRRGGFLLRR